MMLSLGKILSQTRLYSPKCICNKKIIKCVPDILNQAVDRNHSDFVPQDLLFDEKDKEKYCIEPELIELSKEIIHNDHLAQKTLLFNRTKNAMILKRLKSKATAIKEKEQMYSKPEILAVKYLREFKDNSLKSIKGDKSSEDEDLLEFNELPGYEKSNRTPRPIHMPYASTDSYEKVDTNSSQENTKIPELNQDYIDLYEKYLKDKSTGGTSSEPMIFESENLSHESEKYKPSDSMANVPPDWMTHYEQFNDLEENDSSTFYGTPNKSIPVSSIPCGGCGALLHCQDSALPGYLPSELFINQENSILRNSHCQRCHFMKYYKTTLDVTVAPNDYANVIGQIKFKKAAIILMVDLTDFPCSIWPGIKDIIEKQTHIFLVGNKVDLLPNDGPKFLENVKESLVKAVTDMGINKANIKDVSLISASTGYGIENLINKLHKIWDYKGDVYLIGCTNVGKSSLFNALLRSDYCKVQASDLIQRATISPWPGTTLNLLKFPILNPVRRRLWMRTQRLRAQREETQDLMKYRMDKFKETKKIKYASLQGQIGKTFTEKLQVEGDGYISQVMPQGLDETGRFGLDENDKIYKYSRWCYDTPGAILSDQILHLLTTPELVQMLPHSIISPRSYVLYNEQSLFLAGLGRLDFISGRHFIICTVFAAHALPVTICETDNADQLYKKLLETEILVVPTNDPERLKLFPPLESKTFKVEGTEMRKSAADVVLSSAGWIALKIDGPDPVNIRAWTPQGRGIHLRTPSMLSRSVNLKGYRIPNSQVYTRGKRVYVKK
ncbi:nitric oxide-associated protein 1 [Venturia canescens]|uniref:nitric oxide-associated protein 1 n=1 Tax=Venturia canescens TaxID=32260 RepID=UPI001C9CF3F6|nr:nitric oxide-associated protein 1 [Venturia canescens]XP_043280148.1 nitric oxide-associated protein 1 [Venturia canescens]